jgi:hypothetical protein
MPLTPYGGNGGSDWLQSLLANYGAGQPYGPSGYPDNLPPRPYGPPGSALLGYQGATPGGPSMGYPAMGQLSPQAPAQAPSLGQFSNFLASQTAAPDYGPGSQRAALNQTLNPTGSPQAYPPWPTPPAPGAGGIDTPAPAPGPLAGGGIGSDANFPVMGAGGFPTTYAAPGQQPPALSASTAATHANAPPGNPSATPRPARRGGASGAAPAAAASASNPRFVQLDQGQNMDPTSRNRGPQMTALNLAGLFRGGQPVPSAAANPANMPTVAATPVSGPLQGPLSNAPWTYGPQQKYVGWPKKTPYGPDWRDKAGAHSGYQ